MQMQEVHSLVGSYRLYLFITTSSSSSPSDIFKELMRWVVVVVVVVLRESGAKHDTLAEPNANANRAGMVYFTIVAFYLGSW